MYLGCFEIISNIFMLIFEMWFHCIIILQIIIPCTWALMDSDTEEAYTAVFQEIKRSLPGFSMQKVVLTYERALHISVRQEFPEVLIYGSLFHFHEVIHTLAL